MKMSITNKRNSKKMNSIQRFWIRLCVVFACIVAQSGVAYAQRLDVDGQTSTAKACVGEPIVLTASGFGAGVKAVDVYKSTSGGTNFKAIGSVSDPSGVFKFVDDMGNSSVSYYVRAQGSTAQTSTVTVNVNTDCPNKCHQSSTGDYINGTDFNIIGGGTGREVTVDDGAIRNGQVEMYFSDYNVTFEKDACGGGQISNDFGRFFGELKPKADPANYSNYYWFSNSVGINCTPFHYSFKMYGPSRRDTIWDEHYYRMVMRLYVVKEPNCTQSCVDATVKLETEQ